MIVDAASRLQLRGQPPSWHPIRRRAAFPFKPLPGAQHRLLSLGEALRLGKDQDQERPSDRLTPARPRRRRNQRRRLIERLRHAVAAPVGMLLAIMVGSRLLGCPSAMDRLPRWLWWFVCLRGKK